MTYVASLKNAIEDVKKLVPPPGGITHPVYGNADIAFVWWAYPEDAEATK